MRNEVFQVVDTANYPCWNFVEDFTYIGAGNYTPLRSATILTKGLGMNAYIYAYTRGIQNCLLTFWYKDVQQSQLKYLDVGNFSRAALTVNGTYYLDTGLGRVNAADDRGQHGPYLRVQLETFDAGSSDATIPICNLTPIFYYSGIFDKVTLAFNEKVNTQNSINSFRSFLYLAAIYKTNGNIPRS